MKTSRRPQTLTLDLDDLKASDNYTDLDDDFNPFIPDPDEDLYVQYLIDRYYIDPLDRYN